MPSSTTRNLRPRSQGNRAPGDVDRDIGRRMRERREQLGLTMEQVAKSLGLAVPQIQKYETGINRIGAARLLEIAGVLDHPPLWFLTGKQRSETGRGPENEAVSMAQIAELVQIFAGRLDDKGRLAVLEFARHVANLNR